MNDALHRVTIAPRCAFIGDPALPIIGALGNQPLTKVLVAERTHKQHRHSTANLAKPTPTNTKIDPPAKK
jgi:hypothetical protein